MDIHVFRTNYNDHTPSLVWVVADEKNTLWGIPGESKRQLLALWEAKYGHITHVTRYGGVMKPSAVEQQISHIQRKLHL